MISSAFTKICSRFLFTSIGFILLQLANAQNRDISYMSSGGKLNPLQAIMDIRHYTITLDVDIEKQKNSRKHGNRLPAFPKNRYFAI